MKAAMFCNGEHFRSWESENCDQCARFDNDAEDCGCPLAYAIQLSAATDQIADEIAKKLGYAEGDSYMTHSCPEFIAIGAEIPYESVIDPNQMDLPI